MLSATSVTRFKNMANRFVFKAWRSCHVSSLRRQLKLLLTEKCIEENMLALGLKIRNVLCPTYLADLLHANVPAQTLPSVDTPNLTVAYFIFKTLDDRFLCSIRPWLWNSLHHSLCVFVLACSDATLGTVTTFMRLHLLAFRFGGLLTYQTVLMPSVDPVI